MGWGPYLGPAIDSLPGYVARGLPIVAAFPGWVYGPGSWFAQYVLEPLLPASRSMGCEVAFAIRLRCMWKIVAAPSSI